MKKFRTILAVFILLPLIGFTQNNSSTQKIAINIPEVARLGLVSENETNIEVDVNSPTEAGNSIDFSKAKNTNVWINYSSVIAHQNQKRKIVAVVQGEIPEGLKLSVEARSVQGVGKGKLGQSTGLVNLTNYPTDIIVNIGSCYTGKGISNGHQLTYKIGTDNNSAAYAQLTAQTTNLNVVYTLTDYN